MQKDEVESPSTSNSNALARFEFEPGKSKDGTKILMVEWEEEETTRRLPGEWQISWEGKSTVLPANDLPPRGKIEKKNGNVGNGGDTEGNNDVKRLYFLLPPGVAVPSIVTLTKHATSTATAGTTAISAGNDTKSSSSSSFSKSSSSSTSSSAAPTSAQPIVWKTNPLPAIFPPELGASARAAGKKGVLHTIWAKKRLQSLQREIAVESSTNAEGVGLQMAVQEKEWIESNFGVVARPVNLRITSVGGAGGGEERGNLGGSLVSPISPSSPRSPGGGRLMEKLKGLKLSTSEKELSSPHDANANDTVADTLSSHAFNPLSPETSDVAVSSFSAIRGVSPPSQTSTPSQAQALAAPLMEQKPSSQQRQQQKSQPLPSRRVASQVPPASLLAQQQRMNMASLDAFAGSSFDDKAASAGGTPMSMKAAKSTTDTLADDREDDLFALPMSPRSPEMTKSPFSFASRDTGKYELVGR